MILLSPAAPEPNPNPRPQRVSPSALRSNPQRFEQGGALVTPPPPVTSSAAPSSQPRLFFPGLGASEAVGQLFYVIEDVRQVAQLLFERAMRIQPASPGTGLTALRDSLWSDSEELSAIAADLCDICHNLLGSETSPAEGHDFPAFEPLPLPGGSDITKPSAKADTQSLRVRD